MDSCMFTDITTSCTAPSHIFFHEGVGPKVHTIYRLLTSILEPPQKVHHSIWWNFVTYYNFTSELIHYQQRSKWVLWIL